MKWWQWHIAEVESVFFGERCSKNQLPSRYRVTKLDIESFGNSGAASIALAAHRGAKRIVLVGFDCQHTDGRAHWHPDHPKQLGNAGSISAWPEKFKKLAQAMTKHGVSVLNASRATALTMFPRVSLEEGLYGTDHGIGVGADCGGVQ